MFVWGLPKKLHTTRPIAIKAPLKISKSPFIGSSLFPFQCKNPGVVPGDSLRERDSDEWFIDLGLADTKSRSRSTTHVDGMERTSKPAAAQGDAADITAMAQSSSALLLIAIGT
jgi:hypothetical protein